MACQRLSGFLTKHLSQRTRDLRVRRVRLVMSILYILSTFQVNQIINCILVQSPFFFYGTSRCEEARLSNLTSFFSSSDQSFLNNRLDIKFKTNLINEFNPSVRNFHVVLRGWIDSVSSRMSQKSSHFQCVSQRVQTILKPLFPAASCQMVNSFLDSPVADVYKDFFAIKPGEQLSQSTALSASRRLSL